MKPLSLSTMQVAGTFKVEREDGIIKGIAAMTSGMTQASTLPPFMVDDVTLAQAADAINAHKNGVQCRVTHPEVTGADGFDDIVGKIFNARVEGNQVKVDFKLGACASQSQERRIFGLAIDAPEDAGLSIVSLPDQMDFEEVNGEPCLRIMAMHAVDWTGDPAANTAGMLSAQNDKQLIALAKGTDAMNEAQMEMLRDWGLASDADETAVAEFITQLDEEKKAALDAAGEVIAEAADPQAEPVAAASDDDDKDKVALATDDDTKKDEDDKDKDKGVAASASPKVIPLDKIKEVSDLCALAGQPVQAGLDLLFKGKDNSEIRTHMLALKAAGRKPIAMGVNQIVQVGEDNQRVSLHAGLRDAILLRSSESTFGNRTDSEKSHERSADFRNMSFIEMGKKYLSLSGVKGVDNLPRPQVVAMILGSRRAFSGVALAQSTSDFPNIMLDAMSKSMRVNYIDAPSTWEKWASRNVADDFKDINSVALSEAPNLAIIPEGGAVKYAFMEDSKETYALNEYVSGLVITRRALINDDLKALNELPKLQAIAAKRLEDDVAYAILTVNANMSDGNALFSSAHGNLAGSASVFSVTALDIGFSSMFLQKGPLDAAFLELMPKLTLIPAQINGVVSGVINSTVIPGANQGHSDNRYHNTLDVTQSARLSANSTTAWYLAMPANNGQVGTVELSFLRGEESPVLEQETEFDTGDARFKVRHVVAAKALDHRGLFKNAGA